MYAAGTCRTESMSFQTRVFGVRGPTLRPSRLRFVVFCLLWIAPLNVERESATLGAWGEKTVRGRVIDERIVVLYTP